MKASETALLGIFEPKMRFEVPLFQRPYVWSQERQWEPLWEDISSKFTAQIEGKQDPSVIFLGAMVLDQQQTATMQLPKRQVIDGQQRLTTLQIFLAALRDFAQSSGCSAVSSELDSYIINRGRLYDADIDPFKVWPTQADRKQFMDVITSRSRAELEQRYPLVRQKYKRTFDPRPRMVEAYLYFLDELSLFFIGTEEEPPVGQDKPLDDRLMLAFDALRLLLKVVIIDLDEHDDAQIIFETLNDRGERLLPADLLRNFIFHRASAVAGPAAVEKLYEKYWSKFDDDFWRKEVKQGRLNRPRSDLYIQHFLASKQGDEIPIKHLFAEYKTWIDRKKPYGSVEAELIALSRQGDAFRRIVEPQEGDVLFELVTFLDCFDIRTAYPLLLHLLEQNLSKAEWSTISIALESYLLRRAVCGLTTKAYNKIFLGLTKTLQKDGASAERIIQALAESRGESTEWPRDEQFRMAWEDGGTYRILQSARLVHLLGRLDETYLTSKSEAFLIKSGLTIEHLMPQSWFDSWPLPDGTRGLTYEELEDADPASMAAVSTKRRNALIHSIGNLTILTQALNPAVSNSAWSIKKPQIMKYSLLPINQLLHNQDVWDEDSIEQRSKDLFKIALKLWPSPTQFSPDKA
jgi:uncharacterized protein with ParB-like and HNH nuclease domain